MTPLITAVNVATMTSTNLLEFVNEARAEFGESHVRHNDFVTRCKDELDGEPYETFVEPSQITATGRIPAFEAIRMTPDQCKLVAMRESKGVRRRVLARLNALEAERATGHPDLGTDEGKLLMIQELAAKQLALLADNKLITAQRDHAIATKAQIGDKKVATAMATASAKARENAKLKDRLGFSARHATILQVEDAAGGDFDFLPLRRWCKANEVIAESVPDKRYPKGVKAWPAGAWMAVYGVDLMELFGEVVA